MYKLLDWVDINKLSWRELSQNPCAIKLLEKYQSALEQQIRKEK